MIEDTLIQTLNIFYFLSFSVVTRDNSCLTMTCILWCTHQSSNCMYYSANHLRLFVQLIFCRNKIFCNSHIHFLLTARQNNSSALSQYSID